MGVKRLTEAEFKKIPAAVKSKEERTRLLSEIRKIDSRPETLYPPLFKEMDKEPIRREIYKKSAPLWTVDKSWFFDEEVKAIDFFLNKNSPTKNNKILDVGTGVGVLPIVSSFLKPARYVGVDFTKEMVDEARKNIRRMGSNVEVIRADISNEKHSFPIKSETFDQAWMRGMEPWLFYEYKTIDEIRRVLKPGGVLKQFERAPDVPPNEIVSWYRNVYRQHGFDARIRLLRTKDETYMLVVAKKIRNFKRDYGE